MPKKLLHGDDTVRLPTPRMYFGLHTVHAVCKHCDRVVRLDLIALVAAGHGNTALIHLPLRCSGCEWTGHSVIVFGQSYGLTREVSDDGNPV